MRGEVGEGGCCCGRFLGSAAAWLAPRYAVCAGLWVWRPAVMAHVPVHTHPLTCPTLFSHPPCRPPGHACVPGLQQPGGGAGQGPH